MGRQCRRAVALQADRLRAVVAERLTAMFIGHFGLGFGAKRLAPTVSLGTLFIACQFADLLWPVLVLSGIEVVKISPGITVMTPLEFVSYPYSHSLVMLIVWGILFALAYHIARKGPVKAAMVLGALVVS